MKKIISMLFLAVITLTACTDDSKTINPAQNGSLDTGGFARFEGQFVVPGTFVFSDPATTGFSREIQDVNGNIANYQLDINAIVGGVDYQAENFFSTTTFPTTLDVFMTDVATALGLSPTDVGFGDSFTFIATVTTDDGRVFVGQTPSFDADGLADIGNTNDVLLDSAANGYYNAMNFNFLLACPEFTAADIAGVWNIGAHTYRDGFGLTDDVTVTISEIPGEPNKVLVSPILGTVHNGTSFTMTIDYVTNQVTYTDNGSGELMFDDFGLDGSLTGIEGFAFPCVNRITMTLFTACCVNNSIEFLR